MPLDDQIALFLDDRLQQVITGADPDAGLPSAFDNDTTQLIMAQCGLGRPQEEGAGSGETDTNPPGGRCRDFRGGSISFRPGVGAFEVHGDMRLAWVRWRSLGGVLAFPSTDESGTPDGRGRYTTSRAGRSTGPPTTART